MAPKTSESKFKEQNNRTKKTIFSAHESKIEPNPRHQDILLQKKLENQYRKARHNIIFFRQIICHYMNKKINSQTKFIRKEKSAKPINGLKIFLEIPLVSDKKGRFCFIYKIKQSLTRIVIKTISQNTCMRIIIRDHFLFIRLIFYLLFPFLFSRFLVLRFETCAFFIVRFFLDSHFKNELHF